MFGREKTASSIVSSFSLLLQKTWNAWDVRGMVLLSLLLQIALFVLGKRRKYSVSLVNRMILWFAYISADWIAIATLGRLSNSHAESPTTNVLRALWAPLLILHLGGPDTITAYAFEDTQLWTRHLLTLVVQSILAIYVIYLSWTQVWFSFLTLPLILAGIIKYVERILCLKLTNSKKTRWIISIFNDPAHLSLPESNPLLENQESKIVLLGYLLFSAMRPDVNDYLCHKEYPLSFKVRIQTYLSETIGQFSPQVMLILQDLLESSELRDSHFNIAAAELGFIFDVVYTKAALIYTRKGCFLRLCTFSCSLAVLLFFLISVMNESKLNFSRVDIFITISLLVGAVTLEFCTVFSMFCSDWAVLLMLFHDNCLVCKILQYVLQYFPCFLPQQRRWSSWMGQFDLLDYCWNSSKAKVYRFFEKNCGSDILEDWHRFNYTKFVDVPSCLRQKEVYQRRLGSFFNGDSFEATRGEKTLDELSGGISDIRPDLEWSIKVDFDTSIIAWHLATSICYCQDYDRNNDPTEAMESSKCLSDHMMYLLVMRRAMLLPEHCRSFWLDHAVDELSHVFSKASDKEAAFNSLDLSEFRQALENLPKFAGDLATKLKKCENKWELIKAMWIEMLLYTAHSYQHVNHVKQLGQYGHEFLTLIWIMGGHSLIQEAIKEDV